MAHVVVCSRVNGDEERKTVCRRIEIIVPDELVHDVLDAIEKSAKTGRIGDGKIFVSPIEEAVRIRTGERGKEAI